MRKTRVTLDDVAREVGVSPITVSRALHRPNVVSADVRARVDLAVRRMGYVPNPAAQQLARGRSNVIGVVIPSLTNFVFSDVLLGIYKGCEETEFEIQLANTRYSPSQEEKILQVFQTQKPAGLIVTGFEQTEHARNLLQRFDCPIVQIMDLGDDPIDMSIGLSHHAAAKAATEHLIAQGYRAPGFLGARMDPRTQKRLEGYRAAVHEAGLFDPERVITTPEPSSVTLGAHLMADLMAKAPQTDAVLCNNDDLAVGVLFEAQRRHLKVPEQFGICGFNDLEMVAAAEPPITSVRTPRYDMGLRATELIQQRIAGETPATLNCDLGYTLQIRRSTQRRL